MKSRAYLSWIGLEGALLVLSPFPLMFSALGIQSGTAFIWRIVLSAFAAFFCFLCALTIFRRPLTGRLFGAGSVIASLGAAFQYMSSRPAAALVGLVSLIYLVSVSLDFGVVGAREPSDHVSRCLQRARWSALTAPVVALLAVLLSGASTMPGGYIAAAASVIAQSLFLHWSITVKSRWCLAGSVIGLLLVVLPLPLHSLFFLIALIGLLNLLNLLLLPRQPRHQGVFEHEEHWWEILVNHPGRILFTTFFLLCLLGSILLAIPAATERGTIAFIDAVFTSVSAVCVTGLIVLDTPNDFTFLGQGFILLLIQLGGLGIMSLTTVALHAMGRRLSLRHERLMASLADTSPRDLMRSLGTILKFTFIMEGLGAVFLSLAFHFSGDQTGQAIWRGVFTAISAFCNAGFALQSESLIPYQSNPFVLHTVAALIVFGGIAPVTGLAVPRWVAGKPIPIAARIALVTSVVLLVTGTFFMLVFEWNGSLAGLALADKLQNAWFQSVTLRTAGFNSIDIAGITSPTFLIMITFMFIGGSPGGTAGGVKTTTIGILAMTFWSNIANREQLVVHNRRIHSGTIYRAVTVVVSGIAIWFLAVIMLEVTQNISSRELIFEATSAIGTVGLSIGATPLLDEIGKVIIIVAMFAGRIGPISLFMLLNDEQTAPDTRYPVERVSIT